MAASSSGDLVRPDDANDRSAIWLVMLALAALLAVSLQYDVQAGSSWSARVRRMPLPFLLTGLALAIRQSQQTRHEQRWWGLLLIAIVVAAAIVDRMVR